jgi:flap endonuclease-1
VLLCLSPLQGIQGLSKVIGDHAPNAIKQNEIKNYFGRKVAIDASMSIYQFMIAVRGQDGMQLTNEAGETTRWGHCRVWKFQRTN